MKVEIKEIPDHLKPFIRHARHPEGRVERFGGAITADGTKKPNGEYDVKTQYIDSIKRGKGHTVIK